MTKDGFRCRIRVDTFAFYRYSRAAEGSGGIGPNPLIIYFPILVF
jgi:hypothetical protein